MRGLIAASALQTIELFIIIHHVDWEIDIQCTDAVAIATEIFTIILFAYHVFAAPT